MSTSRKPLATPRSRASVTTRPAVTLRDVVAGMFSVADECATSWPEAQRHIAAMRRDVLAHMRRDDPDTIVPIADVLVTAMLVAGMFEAFARGVSASACSPSPPRSDAEITYEAFANACRAPGTKGTLS